ncbi:2-phospho-L-lactate guanylyltransferase [Halobacterium salinarum]|uniref:2-phospho-L-lactate guanylyltransferase n=1 Tax=Halobacterium salinarum TaxID=2242 RepID=UPI001F284F22|nr:2-phospho-L-lactate guanylyltransferase [Halobacterium salinarum]MCF2237536.1 2-phospho-L-lactate guanylyltransferase [Halobacterium salinarum]
MRTVVPFDPRDPKSRLAEFFADAEERRGFAYAMLADVLGAVRDAGGDPVVVATAPVSRPVDAPVTVDDRALSTAVAAAIADGPLPTAVVMADLALATPDAIRRVFTASGDVVLAPGSGGGTNVVLARTADVPVSYHGVSFRDHVTAAERAGLTVTTVDSFRLAADVDDASDLVDVFVHNTRRTREWLIAGGWRLAVDDGTPTVVREPND